MINPEELKTIDEDGITASVPIGVGNLALIPRQERGEDVSSPRNNPSIRFGDQELATSIDQQGVVHIPVSPTGLGLLDELESEFAARWAEEDATYEKEQAKKEKAWQKKLPGLRSAAAKLRAINRIINRENPAVVEGDDHRDHSGHFTGEDYVASVELTSIFTAVSEVETTIAEEMGLSESEIAIIDELNAAVSRTAEQTAKKLRFQAGNQERRSYSDDEVAYELGVKPFERQLRYLLCRTIHEMDQTDPSVGGPLETASRKKEILLALLEETPQLIEDVYATDIPLYEKMLSDFDKMLQKNPGLLEVYLARDGVFAYYGRRAQAAVRRGLLSPERRRQMRESGEVSEYIPKYKSLLINRRMIGIHDDEGVYYDDDFTPEQQDQVDQTVKRYLEQEGLTDEDVHFFDTGFDGSIPETIMKLLGFSNEEINKRIHMVSASNPKRRSKGLRMNHRRAAIAIEHHRPKLIHSAEGFAPLVDDEPITVVAEPSSPEDSFKSLIIREAIHRHFWVRERAINRKKST